MLLEINILLFSILLIIFGILISTFLKSMFFSIEIMYKFLFFTAPLLIFITNFIYLFIVHSRLIAWSITPLIIPLSYWILNKVKDSKGNKTYEDFRDFSVYFIDESHKQELNLKNEDIRIRVKNKKEITLIFNVYSSKDEKIIKSLIEDFKRQISLTFRNRYNVEILIDKKKTIRKNCNLIMV